MVKITNWTGYSFNQANGFRIMQSTSIQDVRKKKIKKGLDILRSRFGDNNDR